MDRILAENIDEESDLGEHRDLHEDLKPNKPLEYNSAAAALEDCPPGPVPPADNAGAWTGIIVVHPPFKCQGYTS